jgi:hypothetical protein
VPEAGFGLQASGCGRGQAPKAEAQSLPRSLKPEAWSQLGPRRRSRTTISHPFVRLSMPFIQSRRTELGIVVPVSAPPSPSEETPEQHPEQEHEQQNRQQRAEEAESPRTVVTIRVVRVRRRWNRLGTTWSSWRTRDRRLHRDAVRHSGLIRRCADGDRRNNGERNDSPAPHSRFTIHHILLTGAALSPCS